ncbi:tyrosyl-tRNA synthetase, partial [Syncephalis pseudoplumigaleata]
MLCWRASYSHHARCVSEKLEQASERPLVVYAGIDPTAPSIHLGNLVILQSLLHFHIHGHTTIALMGGATGAIGDPSGRSTERRMLDENELAHNIESIEAQVRLFFERGARLARKRLAEQQQQQQLDVAGDEARVKVLNNHTWLGAMSALTLLGHVGRHMRVGSMLARDSVKSRLNTSQGISFTEFSYQLLQSYDFWHLFRHYNCRVQIGGSDQWGNITAGIDYIHRMQQASATAKPEAGIAGTSGPFGLTIPLLTTANGQKFGKSAGNAVWLNEKMTSYFDFYQV